MAHGMIVDEAAPVTPDQWARAARRRADMVAEIQRRRDWHPPADVIDLTERFAPRCEPEPPKLDREPESEFERQIAALLAEKPPLWLDFAFWGLLLGLWTLAILAGCVLIAR